jgi:hypothetical protein
MKVTRVEADAPNDLVDVTELPDGECLWAQRRGQRGVLELGPGPLDAINEDLVVIERERRRSRRLFEQLAHCGPAPRRCVGPSAGAGHEREIGDADDAPSGIPSRIAVRRELLDVVDRQFSEPGRARQLKFGGSEEVFFLRDPAAGERPMVSKRWGLPLGYPHTQLVIQDREGDEVDGYCGRCRVERHS